MATREECLNVIEEYRKFIEENKKEHKRFWLEIFSKHGYSTMEEDTNPEEWEEIPSDNPELGFVARGETRVKSKLVFWKEKDKDGIIMEETKHENEYNKRSYGTIFYAVGNAGDYFNDIYRNQKESKLRKFLRHGRERNLLSCLMETIKINERKCSARHISSKKEFENILMD